MGRQNSRKKSEVEGGRAAADEASHPIAADRRKRGLAARGQRLNGSDEGADAERRAVGAGREKTSALRVYRKHNIRTTFKIQETRELVGQTVEECGVFIPDSNQVLPDRVIERQR
ncbi:MAG: hypothetical protein JNM86_16755 [Phycisphaerae bacterium]|nr:hypothetical protein [Phycisphaerae bacterium]